jgi:hypothetical protein
MSSVEPQLSHHPAPQRHKVPGYRNFFLLFGGPLAWFLQLNAGFALATQPCFVDNQRTVAPTVPWSWPAIIALAGAASVMALAATLVAWRDFQRTKHEATGEHRDLLEVGAGRTRFLALWGICFGAGSTGVIVLTALGFFVLPRCGG